MLAHTAIVQVRMVSATEGWAVGDKRVNESRQDGLLLHYTGGRWVEVPVNLPYGALQAIAMDSPTDGWAGGVQGGYAAPALLHYSGGQWTSVPVNLPSGQGIVSIAMVSADEGWALAVSSDARDVDHATMLHYQHGVWTPVAIGGLGVTTLAMASASEGWAAGQQGVIAHYAQGRWTRWPASAPGDVLALTMVSATDGWMTGVAPNQNADTGNKTPFMLHYDGVSWRPVPLPGLPATSGSLANGLSSISMTSASNGWAVGTLAGMSGVVYHYANGAWQQGGFMAPEPLFSISMVSTDEGWAVGGRQIIINGNENGVIVHYLNGQWSVYSG